MGDHPTCAKPLHCSETFVHPILLELDLIMMPLHHTIRHQKFNCTEHTPHSHDHLKTSFLDKFCLEYAPKISKFKMCSSKIHFRIKLVNPTSFVRPMRTKQAGPATAIASIKSSLTQRLQRARMLMTLLNQLDLNFITWKVTIKAI